MRSNKIYCIGDSHVSVFLGADRLAPIWPGKAKSFLPKFEVIRLGPVTAYNLGEFGTTSKGREKLEDVLREIPKKSWIVMSAGEIDCRVHLIKQAKLQNQPYEEITDVCASRYVGFIHSVKKRDYNICLLLPPPTPFIEIVNLEYPMYGSEKERDAITKVFHLSLKKECALHEIPTIDVLNGDDNIPPLPIKKKYLWDGIHPSTFALISLIKQLRNITKIKLKLSIYWHIKETLRNIKKYYYSNKSK